MTRRFIALPLAFAALTALSACGQDDPFADKTYTGCMDADSITFQSDGFLTAVVKGEPVPEDEYLKFTKISDTKVKIEVPRADNDATAELLDDGTLLIEVPDANLSNVCDPVED